MPVLLFRCTPEELCGRARTPATQHTLTQPERTSFKSQSPFVFSAGTLLIGGRTWTEFSTSTRATGRCTSSGSWTGRRTPGTTSPSPPQSSVSAATQEADIPAHFPPSYSGDRIRFLELMLKPERCVLKQKKGPVGSGYYFPKF